VTPPETDAAAALIEVLQAENAALEAMDLERAAALLGAKQAATAALAAAPCADAAAVAEIRALAERNRTLLERGMAVQGRLIGMVAQAARQANAAESTGYGASGTPRGARMPAITLAARA
jgi:hypothetical protein